jgi:hypothetical protein
MYGMCDIYHHTTVLYDLQHSETHRKVPLLFSDVPFSKGKKSYVVSFRFIAASRKSGGGK